MARAVASLPVLLEYLLPLCRMGGHALAQKGASAADEVGGGGRRRRILGGGAAALHAVQLPGRDDPHYLIVIPKERRPGAIPAQRGAGARPERYLSRGRGRKAPASPDRRLRLRSNGGELQGAPHRSVRFSDTR